VSRALVGLVALPVLAGCAGDDRRTEAVPTTEISPATTTTAAEPAPVEGMLATIEISRLFALERALALGLRNIGTEPVQVVRVGLESPLFEPVPAAERAVLLGAGSRELVMPVPYGAARCGDPAEEFTAVVVLDDGREVRMPAPERHPGAIGRQHARECAAADVSARVDLRFGEDWTRDGPRVAGELVLEQRRPGPSVTVEGVSGTVIFGMDVAAEPPVLEVSDDEPVATVSVEVGAERCDPHALIEAKRAFVFLAWLRVDDGEPVAVEVEPTGAARAALDALLGSCID
jgi:hypothetical protein